MSIRSCRKLEIRHDQELEGTPRDRSQLYHGSCRWNLRPSRNRRGQRLRKLQNHKQLFVIRGRRSCWRSRRWKRRTFHRGAAERLGSSQGCRWRPHRSWYSWGLRAVWRSHTTRWTQFQRLQQRRGSSFCRQEARGGTWSSASGENAIIRAWRRTRFRRIMATEAAGRMAIRVFVIFLQPIGARWQWRMVRGFVWRGGLRGWKEYFWRIWSWGGTWGIEEA